MITKNGLTPRTFVHRVEADGLTVFYREAGAEAFRRENPNASVQFLDTGHFALETHVEEIALAIRTFLAQAVGQERSNSE